MTDKIEISAIPPWSITVNGEEVASSEEETPVPPEPGPEPEPGVDWPVMPQNLVDRGVALPNIKYGNEGNSSCNLSNKGTAFLAPIYGYVNGDKRSAVKDDVLNTLNILVGSNGPCGMAGPGAAQECYALTFFHLLRESDLWAGVSSTNKKRIDAIFHAIAMIRCWEGNDGSASEGHKTITGNGDADLKDIGPNISFSIPAGMVLCAEWFGYAELDAWLNSTTIQKVRDEIKAAFGSTSGKLYLTCNWKHAGISDTEEDKYYRSDSSAKAPTDDQVNASLKSFKYYGAPLLDLPKFFFPNDDRGFNKVMPPTKRTVGGNKWVGNNQHSVNNGAGITVSGKKRGYCIKNASSTPHVPGEGCMVYEINGVDEGGIRSAMGYAWWTIFLVNTMLIPMLINGNTVFENSKVKEFMGRWSKAFDIINHFDKNDYNSVAHISNKGGTGGPGPVIWSDDRLVWEADVNLWMWDAINEMAA